MSDADSEADMDVDNGSQKGFGSGVESIFVEGYDDDMMDTIVRMKILRFITIAAHVYRVNKGVLATDFPAYANPTVHLNSTG